ncbi:MAG: TetR/AcrR family transcriptional regulator [Myxococcota bacterium]|nr:TetR/AcrR family transcriptional regulator [Myxococcota bacterium]
MTETRWPRSDESAQAKTRILNAAGRAFEARGVGLTTMSDVAQAAGCSRATLYRYFRTRHDLHVAFVARRGQELAAEISERVGHLDTPTEHWRKLIQESVRSVRKRPELLVWFEPEQAGHTARLSRGSELLKALTHGFMDSIAPPTETPSNGDLRLRWMIRIIISLLSMPGESEQEESEIVDRFILPGLVEQPSPTH